MGRASTGLRVWITNTDDRIYPGTDPVGRRSLVLNAPRGGRVAFQVGVANRSGADGEKLALAVTSPAGLTCRVRRVGYVPMPHHNSDTPWAERDGVGRVPGYVPDTLLDSEEIDLPDGETGAFWVTIDVDAEARVGRQTVVATLSSGDAEISSVTALVESSALVLSAREGFDVIHWFYSDALLDWYGLKPFEDRYWTILEAYMRTRRGHGVDVLYVPLFSPTTDGDRRPSQLLSVTVGPDGGYSFGFDDVGRYVSLGRSCGFSRFEWPHLFTQWGADRAIAVYRGQGADEDRLWPRDTGALSETYRGFLGSFLPKFETFLREEDALESSVFHVSDEPHGDEDRDKYRLARGLLKELAPWMKTLDAVSDISYGREGITDTPVPVFSKVGDYLAEGLHCYTYHCCNPRGEYPNRLLDTPLPKIRALGWILYRFSGKIHGFLHWGYNYWYKSQTRELIDPFVVSDGGRWPGWPYGDTFIVYPGESGPIDSIRWEVFAEGLQDFAIFQSAGLDPTDPLLGRIRGFTDFPRDPGWYRKIRRQVLTRSG